MGTEQEPQVFSSLNVTYSLCLGILIGAYFYYKNAFSYWQKKGLKNPPPWLFAGNFAHLLLKDRIKLDLEWAKQYGKVYGLYMGTKPVLMVADADVLRQICIKDFDKMPNHGKNDFPNKYQSKFVINLRDEYWKKVRAMMTPTFTSGKIKRMFKLLHVCSDDLVQCFSEQVEARGVKGCQGPVLNLKELYGLFTMDAISSCCYGLKLERQQGAGDIKTAAKRNKFVEYGYKFTKASVPRLFIGAILPKPLLHLVNFEISSTGRVQPMADQVGQIIKSRRASGKKFDDYLQILLDAKFDDKMELDEMDAKENHHVGVTSSESLIKDHNKMVADVERSKRQSNGASSPSGQSAKIELTEMEILANAMFLLVVGLETTATLLTHCTYILGFHPEIQEKLHNEIKKIAKRTDGNKIYEFDYDELTSCQYLDAVIAESLRALPPVLNLNRYVDTDYHIEKYNLDVKKNSTIFLSFYAIMNDPDYWPNPQQFDPERFMPANKDKIYPGSYCPFGIGPRHCLGMRFSLTEAKLGLANMIMNFRFESAPGTSYPPESEKVFVLNNIKNPVSRVVKRANI